jgi:hypothetical protein
MKTILVRTSERMSFATCRQKWFWSWVEQLEPYEEGKNLVFGDLVHQSLAIYYKPGRTRGPHPAETFEQLATTKFKGKWMDNGTDMIELGIGMLHGYTEHWKGYDSEYEVVSAEQVFQIPLGSVLGHRVICVGTIDGVWRHMPSNKLRFRETKTATKITEDALPMDEQIGTYWAFGPRWLKAVGVIKELDEFDGIVMDWMRKALQDDSRPTDKQGHYLNKDGSISKKQPAPLFKRMPVFRGVPEARLVRHRIMQQARDMILARRNPKRYVYKNPGPQFMPNCKFCAFRDPCELHETGNDHETILRLEYKSWEPYAAHELAERF